MISKQSILVDKFMVSLLRITKSKMLTDSKHNKCVREFMAVESCTHVLK